MGLQLDKVTDIKGNRVNVVEKTTEEGSIEHAIMTGMKVVMEAKASRKFYEFTIIKCIELKHSPTVRVLLAKIRTDTNEYLHVRIHRGRAYSTFGGTESLWLNLI